MTAEFNHPLKAEALSWLLHTYGDNWPAGLQAAIQIRADANQRQLLDGLCFTHEPTAIPGQMEMHQVYEGMRRVPLMLAALASLTHPEVEQAIKENKDGRRSRTGRPANT